LESFPNPQSLSITRDLVDTGTVFVAVSVLHKFYVLWRFGNITVTHAMGTFCADINAADNDPPFMNFCAFLIELYFRPS
jgi:hypothetical protein